jgi:type IV pilus assembly protein PilC
MCASGVPITQALETLSHQPENPAFGEVVRMTVAMLEKGVSFSKSLTQFPRVFPPIFVTMVQIGEQTGTLHSTLGRLALWLERDENLRQRLKSALSYPAFVFGLTLLLTLALFYNVMPGFVSIFRDMKIALPMVTKVVFFFTDAIRNPGAILMILAALGMAVVSFKKWISTVEGRCQFHYLCLKVPIVGAIIRFGGVARYCSAMEALLNSGSNLVPALRLAATASDDPILQRNSPIVLEEVINGGVLGETLREYPEIYPIMMINFVASGEETSSLPDMFGRSAFFFDAEMNYKVEALGAALEPLMLFGVSAMVGTVVLSVFIPMYAYIGQLAQ